jgi:hypothetical protein
MEPVPEVIKESPKEEEKGQPLQGEVSAIGQMEEGAEEEDFEVTPYSMTTTNNKEINYSKLI